MPEVMNLGPFLIQVSWLLIAAGALMGYQIMKQLLKRTDYNSEKVLDIVVSSLLITALVWKLGPILTNPSLVWNNPSSLLFVTGSTKHMLVGAVIAGGYIYYKMKKANVPLSVLLDVLPYGWLAVLLIYNLFTWQFGFRTTMPWGISIASPEMKYHPVNYYTAGMLILIYIGLWRKAFRIGERQIFRYFLMLYGAGQMLVSYYQPQTVEYLGVSGSQLFYLALIVIGGLTTLNGVKTDRTGSEKEV